ncbi:cyclic nucleotide-binding domain-containing protein [Methylocapsa palsarum]|uniref:Cyclic nucleotide-binding domain-containing protein n=1 Tax=Methylocapsa palsarum TaxID=1612308 RepID=A0A1I4AI61_9HYPH|nr:cyclic nucleotide-binding domain-containing protein [Methylocapsa palsarum]SFK55707.1 Cyclic nucleotide-binding domain-containing protein [Methylocapsa palsarum]
MGLEDDAGKLLANPTLAVLEPGALRLIAFSGETRILRAGDVLFRKDEVSNGGFLVLSGSIALDASDQGAASARIVRHPALIGELALLAETLRPATAIAREPSSVLRISRQLFRRVLNEFPASAAHLRDTLAAKLTGMTGELAVVRRLLDEPLERFPIA